MSWTFRKRVKIIPGVHLNLSKSGISTTIGVRGASLNIGKRGTYLNTGIPGTGISHRTRISNSSPPPLPIHEDRIEAVDNIISANVNSITSQNMEGLKQAILLAHQQRIDLKNDIIKVKAILTKTKTKLLLSYIFIYGLINKDISNRIKDDIQNQNLVLNELRAEIEKSYVALDVEFSEDLEAEYFLMIKAFQSLTKSHRIWDVTGAYKEDTRRTRSAAGTVIKKNITSIDLKQLADVKSKYPAMYFRNLNGPDIYIYPNFVIMYQKKGAFAVIDYTELEFLFMRTRFIEDGKVPGDSRVIDRTWAKVNKNGTPDKRFKGNYQIPVVAYGNILLRTNTGMNENWQFSNYEASSEFSERFKNYKNLISTLTNI